MNNRLYTIQEVANILGVSTKTLRRWDQRGRFVPTRTVGNQRRYTQQQIAEFKTQNSKLKTAPSINLESKKSAVEVPPLFSENEAPKELKATHSLPSVLSGLPSGSFLRNHFLLKHKDEIESKVDLEPASFARPGLAKLNEGDSEGAGAPINPIKLGFMFAGIVLFLSFAGAMILVKYNVVAGLSHTKDQFAKFIENLPQISLLSKDRDQNGDLSFVPQENLVGSVLAAADGESDLLLRISVPVIIGGEVRDPSAIFEIGSVDQGFLAPRMTGDQVDAITAPAAGLFVYNTDTNHYNMYNGISWEGIGTVTAIGDVTTGDAFSATGTQGTSLYFYDADGRGQLTIANLTGVRTFTLPDASGEISLLGQTISNAELVNSKVTVSPGTNMTGGGEVALGSSITLTLKDSITLAGTLTVAGETLLNGNVGIGDAITDPITFTGRVAVGSDLIPIGTTGTNDLGTALLPWDNVFADNVFAASSGTSGYWQRNSNALSPTNITDDILIGATSTSSALIKFSGTSGGNSWFNTGNVGIGDTSPSSALEVGDGTDSLQISSVGDITFVDANGTASITGPAGGAFSVVAGSGQALTLTGNAASTWSLSSGALTFNTTSSNIALTTITSGDITLTTAAATGLANILTGNLKIGNGTPTITQDGEDAYVEGVFEVDGISTFGGNVGIGVTTPLAALDVRGAATVSGALTVDSTATIQTTNLKDLTIGSSGTGGIALAPAGTTSLYVMNGGNIGIATTTPTTFKLEIAGIIGPTVGGTYDFGSSARRWATVYADTGNFTSVAGVITGGSTNAADWLINADNATADTEDATLTFERGTAATNSQFRWNSTTKQITTNSPSFAISPDATIAYSGTSAFMVNQVQSQDIMTASASAVTRFVLENDGDLILGTKAAPINFLSAVAGGSTVFNEQSADIDFRIESDNNAGAFFLDASVDNIGIGTTSPTSQLYVTRPLTVPVTGKALAVFDQIESQDILTASASGTTRFVIKNDGNVGIGMALPTSTLHITSTNAIPLTVASDPGDSASALALFHRNRARNAGNYSRVEVRDGASAGTALGFIEAGSYAGAVDEDEFRLRSGFGHIIDMRETFGFRFTIANSLTSATGGVVIPAASISNLGSNATSSMLGILRTDAMTLTGTGLITYANTATIYVEGAPIAGSNVTITAPYALWVDGGTSRFDGNVGFGGQTTPLTELDVTGSASLSANLSMRGSGTAHTFNILDNGTLNFRRSPGGDAGVSNVFFIGNNGNVGIGNTAPTTVLDVTGAGTFSSNVAVNGGSVTTTATTGNLFNATATTLNIGGAATTALNIGNGNTAYTAINIGSGTGGNTINIAGTGATGADTINIGTGGTSADTITVGNNASSTSIALTSGTGSQTFTSSVASGTAFSFVSNSITSGNALTLSSTGTTTGEILDLTGTWAPTDGSTNEGIDINITHTPTTSADNFQAINLTTTDGTALGNTVYNQQNTLTLTGNAAKTGIGSYNTVTSSSTTADTLVAFDAVTSSTGIIGSGTRSNYGLRTQPASTGANTGGTQNMYGIYSAPSSTLAAGSTENVYGGYFGGTATVASGTVNRYGVYIDNATMNSTGTSTQYGLYVNTPSGADTNYAAVFAGGNVGIGTTSPLEILGVTGNATISGTLTVDTVRPETGALSLQYKSGGNAWTTGLTLLDNSGNVGIGTTAPSAKLHVVGSVFDAGQPSAENVFLRQRQGGVDYGWDLVEEVGASGDFDLRRVNAGTATTTLHIGRDAGRMGIGTTAPISHLHVTRALTSGTTGKALAVFDQIESQDILTASASGTPRFVIRNDGNVGIGDMTPSSSLEVGDGTDSLQVSSVGDITFVDANGAASITGPAGGILTVTSATDRNLALNAQGTGDISLTIAGSDFAFQQGTNITTSTGDLRLDPSGVLLTSSGQRINFNGGTDTSDTLFHIGGSFTGATSTSVVLEMLTNLTPAVNATGVMYRITPNYTEAASGTHDSLTGLLIDAPTITAAGAATTNVTSLHASQPRLSNGVGGANSYAIDIGTATNTLGNTTATSTNVFGIRVGQQTYTSTTNVHTVTNPASIYIEGAPVASTNVTFTNGPYALWVDAGTSRFDGNVGFGGQTTPLTELDVTGSASLSANLSMRGSGTAHTFNILDNGTLNIRRSVGGDVAFATNMLFFENSGNIGIGTTAPGSRLNLADDLIAGFGTDSDNVLVNRSTSLAANTALTGVLIGTPVTTAIPANSLIASNITANGDIGFYLNSNAGNTWEYLRFDGSARETVFNDASSDIDFRVESDGNANIFAVDAGIDGVGIGAVALSNIFLRIDPSNLSFNNAAHTSSDRLVEIAGAVTTKADGGAGDDYRHVAIIPSVTTGPSTGAADIYDLIATLYLREAQITLGTDSTVTSTATLYVQNAATEGTNNYALWVDDGTSRFDGNVGIGTTAPTSMLYVTRPMTLAATGKALAVFDQIESQDILTASASGTPRFVIRNDGNVGIGTALPGAMLAVGSSTPALVSSAGLVTVANTTDSTSGSTGSINTAGGLGVTKDLAVDGGDIVTAATTFNLVNATATTLNLGGAATTIAVGAAASATTWTGQSFSLTGANSTNNTKLTVTNSSNAAAASHSIVDVAVGGTTSTGDPQLRLTIPSGTSWYAGVDNDDEDEFVIGSGTTVGSLNAININNVGSRTMGVNSAYFFDITPVDVTIANSASAGYTGFQVRSATVTLAGTTTVTNMSPYANMGIMTVNQSGGAVTVTEANGFSARQPTPGTSVTITRSAAYTYDPGSGAGTTTNLVGYYAPALTGGTNNYDVYINQPGTANGITTVTDTLGLYIPAATTALGNQTATTTNAMGVNVGIQTYTSTTNTRTVTNPASIYIQGAPVASTNVTFTNGPYALWVDAGTSRFDGNVGFGGQTTPLTELDVTGSASLSANLSMRGSGTAHTFNILDNGTLNIRRSVGGDVAFATNMLFFENSGNIGIGTTAPTAKLHVITPTSTTVPGIIFDATASNNVGGVQILSSGTEAALNLKNTGTGGKEWQILSTGGSAGGGQGKLQFYNVTDAVSAMFLTSAGNVGMGTGTPLLKLDVQDSQAATAAAQIYNTSTNVDADGLVIKLGNTSTSAVASTNHFMSFETFGIGIVGSVQGSGGKGVTYATSGIADFAEYFRKDQNHNIPFGSVVCFDEAGLAVQCDNNSNKIIGVASQRPAFLGGENLGDRSIAVGLVGQVKTRVSTANGAIKIGDPLTTSSIPGVAVKATAVGQILGKAIQPFDGAQGQEGEILVSVNITWYNPSVYVAMDGTLSGITATVTGVEEQLALQGQALQAHVASTSAALAAQTNYVLATDPLFDSFNNKVSSLESKLDLLTLQFEQQASISAYLTEIVNSQVLGASTSAVLDLGDIEADNLTVAEDLMVLGRATVTDLGVTGTINAGMIAIHGIDGEIDTLSGDLYLQRAGLGGVNILAGKIVIDTLGNMTVAGTITADAIEANNYTVLGDESIGSATIPAGSTSVEVATSIATQSSKIFLTMTTLTDKQVTVVEKNNGTFTVAIPQPTTSPISFDWWIVGNVN